jgi:hypothetical protein
MKNGFAPPLVIGPENADEFVGLIGRGLADAIRESPIPSVAYDVRPVVETPVFPAAKKPNRAERRARR